jgi:hypothetical protein
MRAFLADHGIDWAWDGVVTKHKVVTAVQKDCAFSRLLFILFYDLQPLYLSHCTLVQEI